jgi:hypothetical protein
LRAAYDDHAPCGYFYIQSSSPQAADALVRKLLARGVDTVFIPQNAQVAIGSGSSLGRAFK